MFYWCSVTRVLTGLIHHVHVNSHTPSAENMVRPLGRRVSSVDSGVPRGPQKTGPFPQVARPGSGGVGLEPWHFALESFFLTTRLCLLSNL